MPPRVTSTHTTINAINVFLPAEKSENDFLDFLSEAPTPSPTSEAFSAAPSVVFSAALLVSPSRASIEETLFAEI